MASPSSRLGVCNLSTPSYLILSHLISGTGKATDFKFGGYIYRANPNKSTLKIMEKRERGRIQGLPKFLGVSPIISGTGKATDFKFCRNIHTYGRSEQKSMKMLGTVAVGVVRKSRKFSGHPCLGRIARSSCDSTAFLLCTSMMEILQLHSINPTFVLKDNVTY